MNHLLIEAASAIVAAFAFLVTGAWGVRVQKDGNGAAGLFCAAVILTVTALCLARVAATT